MKDIKGKQRVDVDLSGETRNDDTCLANGSILEREVFRRGIRLDPMALFDTFEI